MRALWLFWAIACTGAPTGSPEPADGERGDGSIDWSGAAADPEALGSACRAACAANEPRGAQWECTTLEACVEACLSELGFAETACAVCAADLVYWEGGYCSSWECVCPPPEWPGVTPPACASVCQATVDYFAAEQLKAPVLPSTGHLPRERIDLVASRYTVSFAPSLASTEGKVWAAAEQLEAYDRNLTPLATYEVSGSWNTLEPGHGVELLMSGQSHDGGSTIGFVDALQNGVALWRYELPAINGSRASVNVMSRTPAGEVAVLDTYGRIQLLDGQGEVLGTGTLPPPSSLSYVVDMVVRSDGVWVFLADGDDGPRLRTYSVDPDSIGTLVVTELGDAAITSESWRAETHYARDLDATAGLDVVIAGSSAGSVSLPWIASVAPSGEARWEWVADAGIWGEIEELHVAADGSIYAVGTEATAPELLPGSAEAVCSPGGCTVLTVRRLTADGQKLWEYVHREAGSSGSHVTAVDGGGAVASGALVGTEQHGIAGWPHAAVLLAFDP